ncbi:MULTISPECIES: DUF3012 domain-containing protein [Thiomicrorhabdus]|uniref:DUF3012 domain-containing protein n=1 Tax=Thiomicrorhabdus xiamenensis TaxID=2739063 RepID=A0A7D4T1D9_9GAMM|nr:MULTISPECIES: DUF3012 domain-containing protein [Thiomicrorhabdus]MBO1923084.1 DUF3012 domain-containing protein [Thiomicrorhabdus sp. 6S3-12]QKI89862.1 DUF3012 domain-containing protein [Thiomicrorhabdus xiamenensis]
MKKSFYLTVLLSGLILGGCSAEVGSQAWCEEMDQKPKGEWSANEAKSYAENCIFRSKE